MRNSLIGIRCSAIASVFVVAACGGGGGGGGPATNVIGTNTSGTNSGSNNNNNSGGSTVVSNFNGALGSGSTDANLFGLFTTGSVAITPTGTPSIAAPDAATTGNNSTPPPNSSQPLGNGTAFPLKQTAISISSGGIAADTATNSGGATLSVVNWNPSGDSQFRLTIPSLGIDNTFTSNSLLKGHSTVNGGNFRWTSSNANYATLGLWEVDSTSNAGGEVHLSAFTTGYETPVSGVPTSGTATYSGTHNMAGILTTFPSSGGIARASLLGDASFTANFGTRAITGSFTNVMATNATGLATPWNDVSVSASLTAGTSRFSGTTAVTSVPAAAPFAMSGSATGRIDGGFYGPNANELGAVWSLRDGAGVAIGGVQAIPH